TAVGVDHRAIAVSRFGDVLAVGDHPLAVQEPADEFDVVAGGAHGQGELVAVQPDVGRLLDGDVVALAAVVHCAVAHADGADPLGVGDPAHPSMIVISPAVLPVESLQPTTTGPCTPVTGALTMRDRRPAHGHQTRTPRRPTRTPRSATAPL